MHSMPREWDWDVFGLRLPRRMLEAFPQFSPNIYSTRSELILSQCKLFNFPWPTDVHLAATTEQIRNLYIFFLLEKNRKSIFVQLRLVVSSCSQVEAQNSWLSVVLLLWLQKEKEKIDRKEANEWMEHLMTIFCDEM